MEYITRQLTIKTLANVLVSISKLPASLKLPESDDSHLVKLLIRAKNLVDATVELARYDLGKSSFVLTLPSVLIWHTCRAINRPDVGIKFLSRAFRSDWYRAAPWTTRIIKQELENGASKTLIGLVSAYLLTCKPETHTEKFFLDPRRLYEGVVIVLREPSETHKGVLLIKYSYYFGLFHQWFDVPAMQTRWILVLEPSWSGYCDEGILSYALLADRVYVLTPERHDEAFLNGIDSGLVPIPVGANGFTDEAIFSDTPPRHKTFDVVMVASWMPFKRHWRLLRVLSSLRKKGHVLTCALVGYPGLNVEYIQSLVKLYKLEEQVSVFESVPPESVAEILRASRVNVVWSRFEGINRSSVEGMLCGIPVILRSGFNYGQDYKHINSETGQFATERELAEALLRWCRQKTQVRPREWVLGNMSSEISTQTISRTIDSTENVLPNPLAVKVNYLHGMSYRDAADSSRFKSSYDELSTYLTAPPVMRRAPPD